MSTGITTWDGVVDPTDNRGQGQYESALVSGIGPGHPLVGGPAVGGLGQYDVDRPFARVSTLPEGGDAGAMAGTPGVHLLDDWRDLLNFRGSPMPWLLVLVFAALGLMQFRLNARVGPGKAQLAVG